MKKIFLLIFLSIYFSNSSYNGLLFPKNTFELLTNNSNYSFYQDIILSTQKNDLASTSYLNYPNSISANYISYDYYISNLSMKSSIQIIDYGNIEDSSSGYSFDSMDYIFTQRFSSRLYNKIFSSLEMNYLYSKIDNFNSSVFATKLDFFYNTDEMIIEIFIDNYGKVLNSYTRYIEDLPKLYGYSLLFKPKNLNVLLSLKQECQNNVYNFNFNTELILKNNSIIFGYSSMGKNLYYGDFNDDFFTGTSIGFKTKYKKFQIILGYQNLGPLGNSSSFSLNQLIN